MILFEVSEGPDQTAQADPGLHCLHMSADTLLHGTSHMSCGMLKYVLRTCLGIKQGQPVQLSFDTMNY